MTTVFSRPSLTRCIPIALLVGTVLFLVNQGSVIASGDATAATAVCVAVKYVVPLCVSSAGFFSCRRAAWRAEGQPLSDSGRPSRPSPPSTDRTSAGPAAAGPGTARGRPGRGRRGRPPS
ncbi:nitrate/nitrite transporter NrtS [Streptomyces chartreusis]|uniref:nitrate/nitrite transporter NrtS n=1 Tax=Streptomyces chartreusis TaxID=1969 RepID=UPI0037A2C1D9